MRVLGLIIVIFEGRGDVGDWFGEMGTSMRIYGGLSLGN